MSHQFLIIRGPQLALKIALPSFRYIRLGRAPECALQIKSQEIEPEHLEFHATRPVTLRAIGPNVRVTCELTGQEKELSCGQRHELRPQDLIKLGPFELRLYSSTSDKSGPTNLPQHPLSWVHLAAELQHMSIAGVMVRWIGHLPIPAEVYKQLSRQDLFAQISDHEFVIVLAEGTLAAAHTLATKLGAEQFGVSQLEPGAIQSALDAAVPRFPSPRPLPYVESNEPAMQEIEQLIDQAARTREPTLIEGETGTGKDRLVDELYRRSENVDIGLIRWAAIDVPDLGFPRSALASRGLVVIDEVSTLSVKAQLSLARDLEQGLPPDVHIVATSSLGLTEMVEQGTFNKGLLFRLARFRIYIPPLRERPHDIIALANALLDNLNKPKLTPELEDILLKYSWPGNVRELENLLTRAAMLSGGTSIQASHLPPELRIQKVTGDTWVNSSSEPRSLKEEIAELERTRIVEALQTYSTQTEAAKALGMPLRTFVNRMDTLGIPRARKKP